MTPRRRLAFFIPSLRGGGAERVVLRLAAGFADRGFDADLVVAKAEGPYRAQVPANVRVVDLGHPRVLFCLPALAAYLKRENPEALLSGMEHANLIALWAKRFAGAATRIVAGVHNTESRGTDGLKDRLVRLFLKGALRRADGIVAVSRAAADDYAVYMGLPRESIRVIYNPAIGPEIARQAAEEPRHRWFAPKTSPLILGVGRLTVAKNFPLLIEAMKTVRAETGARLVILGIGPERDRLADLIRRAGLEDAVDLAGFQENPFSYMKRADAFVLCSSWEGLPTVLIEAISLGTPVVATDCPGGSAEILEGGKWGRLVPLGDAKALARAIVETLKDPRRGESSARAGDFTVDKVIGRYAEALSVPL